MDENDILNLVREDGEMMEILGLVSDLRLPDSWIGAGFLRNKVWDHLQGTTTPRTDIDVIYFDAKDLSQESEDRYWQKLKDKRPDLDWSVKNQARMHLYNDEAPYKNSTDALSHWVESATCVAVALKEDGSLVLIAPHGIDDLVNMIVRPSPGFIRSLDIYRDRLGRKKWREKWPKLKIIEPE